MYTHRSEVEKVGQHHHCQWEWSWYWDGEICEISTIMKSGRAVYRLSRIGETRYYHYKKNPWCRNWWWLTCEISTLSWNLGMLMERLGKVGITVSTTKNSYDNTEVVIFLWDICFVWNLTGVYIEWLENVRAANIIINIVIILLIVWVSHDHIGT